MNNNFENTPPVILDWLETFAFSELDEAQQKEVIKHFSIEEYEEMHRAAAGLRSVSAYKKQEKNNNRKNALLEKFDAHHNNAKIIPLFQRPIVWQAASVFLFLLTGFLFFKVADFKKEAGLKQMAGIDTVFVDRAVTASPEIIHDTVYLYKQDASDKKQHNPETNVSIINYNDSENAEIIEDDIYVVPLNESAKERRGTSMRDDSLLKKYAFISL